MSVRAHVRMWGMAERNRVKREGRERRKRQTVAYR